MLFQKDDVLLFIGNKLDVDQCSYCRFYCKTLFDGRLFVWSMQLRGKNYLCLQFGIIYSNTYLCMKGDSFFYEWKSID